jgi:hypothetical protein
MEPTPKPTPPSPVPGKSTASRSGAPGKLDRSHAYALLMLFAVWGGTAWGTHFLFGAGWGWSFLLGPVLLVLGYIWLVAQTSSSSLEGGKKMASIFERRDPPRKG